MLLTILVLILTPGLAQAQIPCPCDNLGETVNVNGTLVTTSPLFAKYAGQTAPMTFCTYSDNMLTECVSCCEYIVEVGDDGSFDQVINSGSIEPGIATAGDRTHGGNPVSYFVVIIVDGDTISPAAEVQPVPLSVYTKAVNGHIFTDWARLLVVDAERTYAPALSLFADGDAATIELWPSNDPFYTSPGVLLSASATGSLLQMNDSLGNTMIDMDGLTGDILARGKITSGNSIIVDGVNDEIYSTSGAIDFTDNDLVTTGSLETGGFSMASGAATGYVLTSDATGVGTWQPGGGTGGDGDWTISGDNIHSSVLSV
jgi:hypothetical protein